MRSAWSPAEAETKKACCQGENADQIVANLKQVEQDAANGECDSAASAADEVQAQIEQLGSDVNAQLRQRLRQGAARLQRVVADGCEAATTASTTEPTTTTTTEKQKTKSTTTTTTTTGTTEPTTSTTTTSTAPPTGGTQGSGGTVTPPGTGG